MPSRNAEIYEWPNEFNVRMEQGDWQIEILKAVAGKESEPVLFDIKHAELISGGDRTKALLVIRREGMEHKLLLTPSQLREVGSSNRLHLFVTGLTLKERLAADKYVGYYRQVNLKSHKKKYGVVLVRPEDAPPGLPMRRRPPYGLEEHKRHYGNGDNVLRTATGVQPCALRPGDVLLTGEVILSDPREGFNGSVHIHLGDQKHPKGTWIKVASRLPIALAT